MLKYAQLARGGIVRTPQEWAWYNHHVVVGQRWISGCSGDDYLRWQELEASHMAAAHGTSIDGACQAEANQRQTREESAPVGVRASAGQASPRGASGEVSAPARTGERHSRESDARGLQVPESLARHMKRAQARWKAGQGRRQQSTRVDHGSVPGTRERGIAIWPGGARMRGSLSNGQAR